MSVPFLNRELPEELAPLAELATDLRWTWSHEGDALWQRLDPEAWDRARNPWILLQDVPQRRLLEAARDPDFLRAMRALAKARADDLAEPGWFRETYPESPLKRVAYFSMEFGLGEALPLYAGGLGILAGDHLKTASDLGIPMVGIGLLYQEGYFRQMIDAAGRQQEVYPYNDPTSLPIRPVPAAGGGWLHVPIQFPGRTLLLRVWQADVGRVPLYLLDSNDPVNGPRDRGITGKLYGGGPELRMMQEVVLGIGGCRLVEMLDLDVDVFHLNEGHAAFAVLERTRQFMRRTGLDFRAALAAVRAGNVFTTHTPVAAGFDAFGPDLIRKYFRWIEDFVRDVGISMKELLALGRRDAEDMSEPFNMAWLAMRGSLAANGVSRLHGAVSRRLFAGLFPRWPESEVPVGHVTNGVHVPFWDSPWADRIWTETCGKRRWRGEIGALEPAMACVPDEAIWSFKSLERRDLVEHARRRLACDLSERGAPPEAVARAAEVLDPDRLTLGFARRFTAYKRPGLLLRDPDRLIRILTDPQRPVQIIVAGKAHPDDAAGKRLIEAWVAFALRKELRGHVVFLEDYDIELAQQLVQGVDLWINTPERPWEASGTSGMKVLVNGGLNLSTLDGWWAEAYAPEVGWAIGSSGPDGDARDAVELYERLEREIVPAFYDRDADGVPRGWIGRVRASMARLAPAFSSNRMLRDYVERAYLPAAEAFARRAGQGGAEAKAVAEWSRRVAQRWPQVGFDGMEARREGDRWLFSVSARLGGLSPEDVRAELYAEAAGPDAPVRIPMRCARPAGGDGGSDVFRAEAPASRPAEHYTPRLLPSRPGVRVPAELPLIVWQR